MIWDDTHTPRILTAQQRARHRDSELAPIACLNWRAEFVCDAINAEFRNWLAWRDAQLAAVDDMYEEYRPGVRAGEAETHDERPAGALTTALALTTFVCCTIAMIVGLVQLIRS
jgi:hypothetical protein